MVDGTALGHEVAERVLGDGALPLVIEPAGGRPLDVVSWSAACRDGLRERIERHGGVLLRGFDGVTAQTFEQVVRGVCADPLDYIERSSPRHTVHGKVFTSTDHPPRERIFLHNEQSYNLVWPLRICFCCLVAPRRGGATPIADCRGIYRRIPAPTRDRFTELGYLYVRNFGSGLGLSWQEAFQTSDRGEVDRYCAEHGIEVEWRSEDELRTRQRRAAVARHPTTGDLVWFNHITFFHVSTLGEHTASELVDLLGEENLPNNTYYGDGTAIEPHVLDELRAAYEAETVEFAWQRGDVLLLDNMLTAHGRAPFSPPRQIVVSMAEPTTG